MQVVLVLVALLACGHIDSSTAACEYNMDLLFLVDGSESICGDDLVNCEGWNRTRQFMHKIAENMNIGPDASRVALLKFGADVTKEWDFNENTNMVSLLAAIDSVERPTGEFVNLLTPTVLLTQEFNVFSGDRPWITRVVFMVTDGMPNYKPYVPGSFSKIFQLTGVTFFVGCITGTSGHGDLATAQWIASSTRPPNTQTYWLLDDYASLESDEIVESALEQICLMLEACYVNIFGFLIPICNVGQH